MMLTLPVKSADVGLAEVVSVVITTSKCHFRQDFLICPDEGLNTKTLTEILIIYIHNSIIVGISTFLFIDKDLA